MNSKASRARYIIGTRPAPQAYSRPAVGVVLALLGLTSFSFLIASIVFREGIAVQPGWSAAFIGSSYQVAAVEPTAAGAGLRVGDRVVSINGDTQAAFYGPALALSRLPAGATYSMTISRGEKIETVSLHLLRIEGSWREILPNLIVCALLYALGLWIGAVRFAEVTGRLATLTFLLTVFTFFSVIVLQFPGWNNATSALALAIANLARPLNLAVGYDFYSRFPHSLPESGSRTLLRRVIYAIAAILWVPLNIPSVAQVMGITPGPALLTLLAFRADGRPGALLIPLYETGCTVMMMVVLARNYRLLRDADARRRIRWAALGFVATLGIFFAFAFLKILLYVTGSSMIRALMDLSNQIATVVIALSCIALAYAVARQRVLGIHVVIRRGLQYLLARNALQVIVVLPVLILAFEVIRHPDQGFRDLVLHKSWAFYISITATAAISLRYRRQMRSWLDRRFFLPEFEREQALIGLVERIKTAQCEAEICLSAAREIEFALHVDGLHIFLREEHTAGLRVAYSQVIDTAVRVRNWLNDSGTALLSSGSIFNVYECEDAGPGDVEPAHVAAEQLVIPMIGTSGDALGALVLGPKRSDQPYTVRDRDLLRAVAGQIALVYEVISLRSRVEHEQRVRLEVLGRLDDQSVEILNECPHCGRCYTTAQTTCEDDGSRLTLTLPVERTIDGKYRLERRIGRGGMGVVYIAGDERLGRTVAIKIMVGDLFGNTAAMARFEREARLAATLNHPHVVPVYDYGRLATGGAYIVMEFIRGMSWRERLRRPRSITVQHVSAWMKQLCSALEAAHNQGIVHRDLKPENLMIADDEPMGRVMVLDFGLAKRRSEHSDRELTVSGAVMGTHGYMSPEQRMGKKIDVRTDVFALAVICTETLTGRRPPRTGATSRWMHDCFEGAGLGQTAVPQCIERAMALNRSHRPSVSEFWQSLSSALADVAIRPATAATGDDLETLSMRRGTQG